MAALTGNQELTASEKLTGANGWYWLTTAFAGVVLLAIGWPVYAAGYGVWVIVAMLVALGQAAAPMLAVRFPTAAIVISAVSSVGGILATAATSGLVWPWAVTAILSLAFTHAVIGLRQSWQHLLIFWAVSTAIGASALVLPHAGELPGALANVITTASITAGVGGVAVLGRLWLTGLSDLAAERRLGAEEAAKRSELEDRNRIAQELHDVVAHSMSVISVQATTARYRLPDLDDRSLEEFDSIAGSARQALSEMRGLLTILRGGRDADIAPQPTVEDIPGLVSATRGTGAEVALDFGLAEAAVAPTTGLTAFRVVQEGLSNALRHAPGAPVRVHVGPGPARSAGSPSGSTHGPGRSPGQDLLVVSVVNGAPPETAPGPAASGSVPAGDERPDGSGPAGGGRPEGAASTARLGHLGAGLGLKGMRERVEGLGGTLTVGPTPEGGFAVTAVLPLT